jgi:osmotically-inducible protein OsmY
LAENIGDGFDRDPTLSTEDLRVTVRRGVVTLRGEVSDLAALERALDVAASVEGVRRVVSKLTVEVSTG